MNGDLKFRSLSLSPGWQGWGPGWPNEIGDEFFLPTTENQFRGQSATELAEKLAQSTEYFFGQLSGKIIPVMPYNMLYHAIIWEWVNSTYTDLPV